MIYGRRSGTEAELLDWLRTHVRRDDECLVWAGCYQRGKTPVIRWRRKTWMAGRLLVTLARGPVPKGWRVFSTCGTPGCIAEQHLRTGTAAAHCRWRAAQGMNMRGIVPALQVAMARAPTARAGLARRQEAIEARAAGDTWAVIGARMGVQGQAVRRMVARWDGRVG